MAVVTRPCSDFQCMRNKTCLGRTSKRTHNWTIKSTCEFLKTQLCTIAMSLTLFSSVRLPREANRYGAVPYLVLYTLWLLTAGLSTTLLQLAMGQLSRQDPVGVWRAVPILRGVGHLKILTSYICCLYYCIYVALAMAYLIWIGKGSFPLKDCTKLHLTPHGYENKMNASDCFKSTFLVPFTEYPMYLGIMACLIFLLWFFVPISLYRLHKTMKIILGILATLIVTSGIILCVFLSDIKVMNTMLQSCQQWSPLTNPSIWYSALVQALLSSHVTGGYLISAGGSVYKHSDVRWTSAMIITTNIFTGWLWVFMWESIGGWTWKDDSFISILILIYQSSVTENREKVWPLLSFTVVLLSGIVSMMLLLFPVYDKVFRCTGDKWRMFTWGLSSIGTALTVAILSRGQTVATLLDDMIVPVLAVFTCAVEIIGFVFIYGWSFLAVDIKFLTGVSLPYIWIATWWLIPIIILGVSGWWLRAILQLSEDEPQMLWPLVGVFIIILVIMVVMAAVAVAKEEQFNFISKIVSAFRPSRVWGPEEPMARYIWMSQRYINETLSSNNETISDQNNFTLDKKEITNTIKKNFDKMSYNYNNHDTITKKKNNFNVNIDNSYDTHQSSMPRSRTKSVEDIYRSPNICIAKAKLGGPANCNCNRHFTLNVPDLRSTELTTSL